MSSAVRIIQTGVLSAAMVLAFGGAAMASTTQDQHRASGSSIEKDTRGPNSSGVRSNKPKHKNKIPGWWFHNNNNRYGNFGYGIRDFDDCDCDFGDFADFDDCDGYNGRSRGRGSNVASHWEDVEINHQEQYGLVNLGANGLF